MNLERRLPFLACLVACGCVAYLLYFLYRVELFKQQCSEDEASAIVLPHQVRTSMLSELASVSIGEADMPVCHADELGVGRLENGMHLLADVHGDWALLHSNCTCVGSPPDEARTFRLGPLAYTAMIRAHPSPVMNLVRTNRGQFYVNYDHVCMIPIPEVGTIEEFVEHRFQSTGWTRLPSNPRVLVPR